MIKLIATDIDGTLLEEGTVNLNPEYFDVIRDLQSKGVVFIAASGRQRKSIEEVFAPIKDDIIMLSENGAVITSKEFKHRDVMDPFIVRSMVEDAQAHEHCHAFLCAAHESYTDSKGLYEYMKNEYKYEVVLVDDIMKVQADICKVSIFHQDGPEKVVGEEFIKKWGATTYIASAGDLWLDCMNTGVNKGTAVKRFQEAYNITKDETLAFGDNNNDIEMLKRASHSFAVANARQEVKDAANFVTDSNKNDGVLKVLKAVQEGKLYWSKDNQ